MGFFSSLLKIASPIVAGFLGGAVAPAIAAPAPLQIAGPAPIPSAKSLALAPARTFAPGTILGVGETLLRAGTGQVALPPSPAVQQQLIAAGLTAPVGAGKNVTLTVVTTRNPAGAVVKTETLRGRPFIMRRDFVIARRVQRQLAKAAARVLKTARKPSKQKLLTDAVVDTAMRNVLTGHHDGHHNNGCP